MFGLTFEKLLLVAIVAGVVIGPQQLPGYVRRLAETVRSLRRFVETSHASAESELGLAVQREQWLALDPRQYDPRRIVRDALDDTATGSGVAGVPTVYSEAVLAEASRVRPGQRYLVTGSAAHPQRVLIDTLAPDDPRRLAARVS